MSRYETLIRETNPGVYIHVPFCAAKCPYGLDTPKLLEENYKDYKEILAGKQP